MNALKFIADVHLGKLARGLRLLGFDTSYNNTYTPQQLLQLAAAENRILLSRSAAFSKQVAVHSFLIEPETTDVQLQAAGPQFGLQQQLQPFTRCLICNGLLLPVPKHAIIAQLKPNTAAYFNDFWSCVHCQRIYWKGTHYKRMQMLVQRVQQGMF